MVTYRPEVDGLRALAVVPVILFHAGFSAFGGGFVGVDVFFVISGYLITSIIMGDLEKGRFSIAGFYERRARRILPALFVVLAASFPFAWLLLSTREMTDFAQSLSAVALFGSNILFWQETGYFDTAAELKPLLHTWSLAVEEQFYIVFPLVLAGLSTLRRQAVPLVLAGLLVASLAFAEWLLARDAEAAFFLFPTRAWELLIGALCAVAPVGLAARLPRVAAEGLAALGLAMLAWAVFAFDAATPTPGVWLLMPTLGTALIILFARDGVAAARLLSLKPLVGVGLVSYSAYLWHQPVFAFYRLATPLPQPAMFVLLSVASLAIAWMSWRFVEQPFRNRAFLTRRQVLALSLAAIGAVAAVGQAGEKTRGFEPLRQDIPVVRNNALLAQAQEDRLIAIRSGVCQFNERGRATDIATFIRQWDCRADDEGLIDSRTMVIGDSHSADKAVALRLAGVDTVQIGVAGCPVAPPFEDRRPYCRELFEHGRSIAREQDVDRVILVSRLIPSRYDREYIAAMLDYWGGWPAPVTIISPMPDFSAALRQFQLTGRSDLPPDHEPGRQFFALLEGLTIPENVTIVDGAAFWCDADGPDEQHPCTVARDGVLLMPDGDHLTPAGARIYGENMLRSPELARLLLGESASR